MITRDQPRFGETFSWPLWDAAQGVGSSAFADDFTLEGPSDALGDVVVGEVHRPCCFSYAPEKPNGRAALVLAGGGYIKLVVGKEGFEIARWLAALGYYAFVLVHRFPSAAFAVNSLCGAQAPVDDAIGIARVGRTLLADRYAAEEGVEALEAHYAQGIRSWKQWLRVA